ncbi:MAG: HAD-IA family hydrolase [Pseudomonadota bacterium]
MLKLAIFDVDGTLIDSQAIILASMAEAHDAAGIAMPDRATVLSIVGLSLPVAMRRLHPEAEDGQIERLSTDYKHAFGRIRAEGRAESATPFYPGAMAALERLDRDGWLLGIATGKARRGLRHLFDAHGIEHLFVATQTADDAPSKPHPGMVENLLAATGVEAGRAVMIGDTRFDIEMGRAAGAGAVGVAWGYHPAEALAAAGAARVIDDYAEIDAALDHALEGRA